MRSRKPFGIGIILFMGLLALSPQCHAYLSNAFNAKHILDSADLVCHGEVLSINPAEVENDTSFQPPLHTDGRVARVQILNTIKGDAHDQINVVFRMSTDFVFYTQINKGHHCILFLRKQGEIYRFVDDHNGVLEITPHEPISYTSNKPDDRLIEELILVTKLDKGRMRLTCIEELGRFPADRSIEWLKQVAEDIDMAVQGVAYAALIALDTPPSVEELSRFFARQDDTKSLERFGTTGYDNGQLKGRILNEIELRFNIIERDYGLDYTDAEYVARRKAARIAADNWKDFDLIGLLESARDTRDVRDNAVVADIVGEQIDEHGVPAVIKKTYRRGSRAIVLSLLNSVSGSSLFDVVRAIDRMITEPHSFPYPQRHESIAEIDTYVRACRLWLAEHPNWEIENKEQLDAPRKD